MSIKTSFTLLPALILTINAAKLPMEVVHVEGGAVEGTVGTKPGVHIFKGIPYAAPPVGELRWKAPQPVVKWTAVRLADHFGPRCMQAPVYNDMIFRDTGSSEDCLHINVWTPAKSPSDKLPVMFWIHGGGFQAGASSEPRQDGEVLASRGLIVVSVNYRMGVFGFLAHPDLTRESAHHASGNYGLLDQWAALEWVHKNIKAFGGDPKKVTIFGESAGSFSVSALMASPLSKDLIAGAIGESGAFFGPTLAAKSLSAAEEQGAKFGKLDGLRAMPADQLLTASKNTGFNPIIDGYFLPSSPAEIFAAGKQAHVPLLAGWNADEMPYPVLMSKDPLTADKFAKQLADKYSPEADAMHKAYAAHDDREALQAARELSSDQFIGYSTWKWIDTQAKTGGGKPVYRYSFTRVRPVKPGALFANTIPASKLGAVHASEIEYVFGALDSNKEFVWAPEDYKVSEMMQIYWTNFAKSGDPNGGGLPKWGVYPDQVMRIDVDGQSAAETHRDRYETLDRFYAKKP